MQASEVVDTITSAAGGLNGSVNSISTFDVKSIAKEQSSSSHIHFSNNSQDVENGANIVPQAI